MRLRSVTIDSYKNLKGTYSFEDNSGYIALIGLNGSGKSNLLEAISIIFDKLLNNRGADIPFDYRVEYEMQGHSYTIGKREATRDGVKCSADEILLPSSLIACYSGEDLRLWHIAYETYHMGFFNKAVKESFLEPKLLYINKYCWTIALLSLICSDDLGVKAFLSSVLNIHQPSDVEVSFTIDVKKRTDFGAHDALIWFDAISAEGLDAINVNTIATKDIFVSARQVPDNEKAKYIFYFLYLLSQPKKNEKNKIEKLITDIKIHLNLGDEPVDFEDLSEGEKKLILIECIARVLGGENALILFDEPDAHTHVAMKKDLLKLIAAFPGQTIMTTHSPMFLNKRWEGYQDTNIFYINNGKIETTEPLKHLAELTDNEIDYFNSTYILGAKNLLIVEGPNDKRYLERAISILAKKDKIYGRLSSVSILPGNSAGNAKALYDLVLKPKVDKIDHIVYLFDYDSGGYDGYNAVKKISDPKVNNIFYQHDYSYVIDISNKPDDKDTIMVEDFFSPDSYATVVDNEAIDKKHSHKDFRIFKKNMASSIKTYIEHNYNSDKFKDEWFNGFEPVLNKLLEVFELNN